MRELQCLVRLMVGGVHAIHHRLLTFGCVVGMQLDHQVPRRDGIRTVNLDLVVSLRARFGASEAKP